MQAGLGDVFGGPAPSTIGGISNPFQDFLETEQGRRAAFFGATPGFSQGGNRQQFFTNLFPQFENRFLGALGQQIQGGGAPTLTFQNFLSENFDPRREILKASPFQTGLGTTGLVSPGRQLFSF